MATVERLGHVVRASLFVCITCHCHLISTMMAQSLLGTTSSFISLSPYIIVFLVGFSFSDFVLVLPLGHLGCRGYLKVLQSVLQTLLLFAQSLM